MKKLILTSTALLAFAAASFAQTNQTGVQQEAVQLRTGQGQTGIINQQQNSGTNYGNYAITVQGQQSNTGPNAANINQNGANGNGSQGNRAGITQNGGGQGLAANNALINQNGGPEGLSGGGVSSSATMGAAAEDGNFAGIAQQGTQNTATINQNNNSRRNGGEIYQNGSVNTGTISQSNGSINNDAYILQGYNGQNVIGTAVNNATATINQGRIASTDAGNGNLVPESVTASARITQQASNTTARIDQGTVGIGGTAAEGANANPTGTSNGRADGSVATVNQVAGSDFSVATIEQGVYNAESFGSQATITQSKSYNQGRISQGGSSFDLVSPAAGVGGSDQGSIARLTQNGAGTATNLNRALITQGTRGGTTLENVATLTQSEGVVNGSALITQGAGAGAFSSNDEARITQASQANTPAAIGQTGAIIIQNSSTVGGASATGRLNLGVIDQRTGVLNSTAFVLQGYATAAGANITASRNEGRVTQVNGTGLRAIVQQGANAIFNTPVVANPAGTPAVIATYTDLFTSTVAVPDGTAIATPLGNIATNNIGTIQQDGGTNHSAQIVQNGRFNRALINQGGAGTNNNVSAIIQAEGSDRASAEILQNAGQNNVARITQFSGSDTDNSGTGNFARIQQLTGSNNVAVVQQGRPLSVSQSSSNDNTFDLIQNGSNNSVRFLQTGNRNYASITQQGNNNVVRGQGAQFASQQGYGNRLVLTQSNGTNQTQLVFQNTQVGNNLTATQMQSGN